MAYGEIVYRNPLKEKWEEYRKKHAWLLAWFIDGQVDKVPTRELWLWNNVSDELSSKCGGGKLLYISDFPASGHLCSPDTFEPFGEVKIYTVPCWKCGKYTKAVFLSEIWLEYGEEESYQPEEATITIGEYLMYLYLRQRDIPQDLWVAINKREGTKYFPDRCNAYWDKGLYIINHCQWCGAIQGDGSLSERIEELKSVNIKVCFQLTKWEKEHYLKRKG